MPVPKVFISHSSRDSARSKRLRTLLSLALGDGNVWMSPNIRPGARWWRRIQFEVKDRDCLVLLGSENSWNSIYCRAEVTESWTHGHQVVVIQTGDSRVPSAILNEVQIVDLTRHRGRLTAEALAKVISGILMPDGAETIVDPHNAIWRNRTSQSISGGLQYKLKVAANVEPSGENVSLCNSGILLQPGDRLFLRASGEINVNKDELDDSWLTADGVFSRGKYMGQKFRPSVSTFPTTENPEDIPTGHSQVGVLFCWVGDYGPQRRNVYVGAEKTIDITSDTSGFLHLAVNDNKGQYRDNSGEFHVTVEHTRLSE